MKSYYHTHEIAYKSIQARGLAGWGDAATISDMSDPRTLEYLRVTLTHYFSNPKDISALDLGCGTGATAFVLSKLGFQTSGVDISNTAIEMATKHAEDLNLSIQFKTGDVLRLSEMPERYDVIYDSHCFHCIVLEEDRAQAYTEVRKSLKPEGLFVLDTMVFTEGIDFSMGLRFDADYILWNKTRDLSLRGSEMFNGEAWCIQRRIPPATYIENELRQAGFKILASQEDAQDPPGHPNMFRVVAQSL